MRKSILSLILTIILTVTFLTGCGVPKTEVKVPDDLSAGSESDQVNDAEDIINTNVDTPDEGTVNQGITVNQISFEVIDVNTLSEELITEIDTLKLQRGYEYWLQEDGSYLILISAGEKRTGGYGIEVNSIEDNEGKTIISVIETEPAPDAMVTDALTYPIVVIKASGITDQFVISDQNQNEYPRITKDSSVGPGQTMPRLLDIGGPITGIYQGLIDNRSIEVMVGDLYTIFNAEDISQYLKGIEIGDTVEIKATNSPDNQLILESIIKVE